MKQKTNRPAVNSVESYELPERTLSYKPHRIHGTLLEEEKSNNAGSEREVTTLDNNTCDATDTNAKLFIAKKHQHPTHLEKKSSNYLNQTSGSEYDSSTTTTEKDRDELKEKHRRNSKTKIKMLLNQRKLSLFGSHHKKTLPINEAVSATTPVEDAAYLKHNELSQCDSEPSPTANQNDSLNTTNDICASSNTNNDSGVNQNDDSLNATNESTSSNNHHETNASASNPDASYNKMIFIRI